ncbi:MAG: ABC transporter ATP-binding protein [Lachnospiraceae bacterium]
MKTMMRSKGNLRYVIKTVGAADKGLVWFTLIKNAMEQIFYVFFFVYLTKYIFECIEKNIAYSKLFWFLVMACSLHIVIHFMCGWYECYRQINTPKIYRYIFHQVMDISDRITLSEYEDPKFYDSYTKALEQCVDKAMQLLITFGRFLGNLVAMIMTLVIVISVDPVLLIMVLAPIGASFFFGKKAGDCEFLLNQETTRNRREADYVKRVFYEKKYAGELRLYDMQSLLLKRQEVAIENQYKTTLFYRLKTAMYSFWAFGSYSVIATVASYIYVAFMIKLGFRSDVASYVAMINALAFSGSQFKDAMINGIFIRKESAIFSNLRAFLETPRETVTDKPDIGEVEEIVFDHVTFTYPGAKEPTIKDVSFTWKKGERIALVGYNGAGKTTLVKLIMGLYPVTSGRILVNGRDINEIDMTSFREHFGTVFQDLQVFAMTLAENVLLNKPESEEDYDKAKRALIKAQFDVTDKDLVKGMDTVISREFDEEGFVCSGGQAQKIAIARVFYKNPDMVILDEPSSALDPLAEYNMYVNMMKASEGKGVIFISHRLSSARMAQHIFMMRQGEIIEQGTHEELMKLQGEYYHMFQLQAQNYQESLPEEMFEMGGACCE